MKILNSIVTGIFALVLLAFLDVCCEVIVDVFEGPPQPTMFRVAEWFSPVWFSYLAVPICVGIQVWQADRHPPVVLTFIGACIFIVLIRGSSAFILLNGTRPVSLYRYVGNIAIVCAAAIPIYLNWKRSTSSPTEPRKLGPVDLRRSESE